ncbi:hypothetical protein AB6A40_006921 [Gnathostoma spinigerum]|uniref:Phosphatidylinositol-glycan biosynthesis class X protein n=1 Tax=Gnathostoma spinigerum TaxID=75299 RepID=A0ABD6EUH6_9BILA
MFHILLFAMVLMKQICSMRVTSCTLFDFKNTAVDIKMLGAGLHRRLLINSTITSTKRLVDCQILYKFLIPSGAYINMDSVHSFLHKHNVAKAKFDIEAPEEKSEETDFYLCPIHGIRRSFIFAESFQLPVHLRYHKPSRLHEATVLFRAPSLLLRCGTHDVSVTNEECKLHIVKAPCDCSIVERKCDWLQIPTSTNVTLRLSVPTGNIEVRLVVITVTLLSVLLSLSIIIFSSLPAAVIKDKRE